jgi:hypothetical protein
MGRACSRNGQKRTTYMLLVGKQEGKTPPGRRKHMWVGNIKIDLGEIEWGGTDWNVLDQDRNK